jgi:hypothetical protein
VPCSRATILWASFAGACRAAGWKAPAPRDKVGQHSAKTLSRGAEMQIHLSASREAASESEEKRKPASDIDTVPAAFF